MQVNQLLLRHTVNLRTGVKFFAIGTLCHWPLQTRQLCLPICQCALEKCLKLAYFSYAKRNVSCKSCFDLWNSGFITHKPLETLASGFECVLRTEWTFYSITINHKPFLGPGKIVSRFKIATTVRVGTISFLSPRTIKSFLATILSS